MRLETVSTKDKKPGKTIYHRMKGFNALMANNYKRGIGPTRLVLLLTTTGRKSGQKREAQLVYTDIAGVVHVVASNFGGKSHPSWSYNLDADPNATMQIRKDPIPVRAELLSSEEKDAIWDRLVDNIPNYKVYKERTERNIKVYRLKPKE